MFITLRMKWIVIDGSTSNMRSVALPPGQYAIERIDNPYGFTNSPWLVLRGTKVGANEEYWRGW